MSSENTIDVFSVAIPEQDLADMEAEARSNGAGGSRSGAVRFCAIQYLRLMRSIRSAGMDPVTLKPMQPAKAS